MSSEAWVTLGIALVGVIAWFTRLESLGIANRKELERQDRRQEGHEAKLEALDNRVMDKLSKIENIVANIQGRMTPRSNSSSHRPSDSDDRS